MAPGDKSRNHTSVAQIPHTETKPYLQNVAVPRGFERHSHVSRWRPDCLAGHVMSSQTIPLKARADSQDPGRIPAMETTRV